jgi:SPP1 gp7 family putative phage head morphogenesis protein
MKQLRAAGLGKELTKIQRGYARRVYDSLRDMGSNLDAKSRGAIATLIADGTPQAKAIKILDKLLDLPRAQLETIYRTEIQMAYQTGKWAQAQERWDDIWGFRYVTMHDDRVRPTHAALDGIILPKDSSFWQRYWPPNGWNCRCQVVTIYKTPGVKPKTRRPEGKLPLPDDGFRHNPGEFPFVEFSWDPDLHPRVDAGHQGGGQFTSKDSWPKSMSDLKHVSTLGGSTGAMLMEDEHGNKFVVKSGKKSGQAENEWIANQLYKALGVKVPDGIMLDGKHVMKYIDGKLLSELSGEELKQAEELR